MARGAAKRRPRILHQPDVFRISPPAVSLTSQNRSLTSPTSIASGCQLSVGADGSIVGRGLVAQGGVEPVEVVFLLPVSDHDPRLGQRPEDVDVLIRLLRHPQLTAHVGDVIALTQHPIRARQLAHDLLRTVSLPRRHRHLAFLPITGRQDSHSTWINQTGSDQVVNALCVRSQLIGLSK